MNKSRFPTSRKTQVVVATTVMLSFISFWRAAAIVLNDLASSAFYAGGIAEQAVGRAAPWFILGVMLFSYAVRAIYVESCAMFTRGGVYRVVKEAMGGTLAKVSVSALMFDFLLTGPISGVSAGQYIIGLVAQSLTYCGFPWAPNKTTVNLLSAGIAALITIYFWRRNIRGIHESSGDALRIMKVTTVMVVLMILWAGLTLLEKGPAQLPPVPTPHNLEFSKDAVGWLPDLLPGAFRSIGPSRSQSTESTDKKTASTPAASSAPAQVADPSGSGEAESRFGLAGNIGALLGLIGIFIAFGHAVLAMSGEETLAQVNRELEYPKHKNLMKAGLVIFLYSVLFTSLVCFFAALLIPNSERAHYFDNLIAGVAMNLMGPIYLRLIFQAFVVLVGFLILAGAVNTAIIGSNGVLNRVSEDGVLTDWFRAPHRKYGTSYRLINLIVVLQLATIVASRGEVYVLGEAYAFGVIWSFALNGLSVLVLRYRDKSPREWKVPGNFRIGNIEIPLGLGIVSAALFFIAVINLFTKQVATISGVAFTLIFFIIFTISDRINQKKRAQQPDTLEQFNLAHAEDVDNETVRVKPGNVLVPVRNYNKLDVLEHVLASTDTEQQDIVVLTVRVITRPGGGERQLHTDTVFTDYEQKLFSAVVTMAEKHGKPVQLLVVPANNFYDALAQSALKLDSGEIAVGVSSTMDAQEQAQRIGRAWERLTGQTRRQVNFKVFDKESGGFSFVLGAHAPHLTDEDIEAIHEVWLRVVTHPRLRRLHHRDVVRAAVDHLNQDLKKDNTALREFDRFLGENPTPPTDESSPTKTK